jgi:hypothetical protein
VALSGGLRDALPNNGIVGAEAGSRVLVERRRPIGTFESGPRAPTSIAAELGPRRTEPFNSSGRIE